ncbi:hypothetical protein AMATHDRAFT_140532 [Amanita thiersii Skay4041]|uniref:BHLH domain-containing protein n=1 Tax=Amanita thiersii Skay4041 TaxID=703135 RepID=A0A2A9NQC0_9AGAR|nr:hypothetical protein AMATHDRAFT_140532 [Amanita thiersii Skay4041]
MDFEHAPKTPSYVDSLDNTFYMDNLDYLQYPQSPSFGMSMTLSNPSSSPMAFPSLSLPPTMGEYTYASSSFSGAQGKPFSTEGVGICPPALYDLSSGEVSSDSARPNRGASNSPPAGLAYSSVPRSSQRYNPIAIPPSRARLAQKRRGSRSNDDSDDDDEEFQPTPVAASVNADRRESIRKQRIESEQRRRDELREGYARLKETLPASNQKSSKVSLLDRATGHIRYLESVNEQLEKRLQIAEAEVIRLRNVNETLMINTAKRAAAAASSNASSNLLQATAF